MRSPTLLLAIALITAFNSCAQSNAKKQPDSKAQLIKVGGSCEGCEAIYESPIPLDALPPIDTLPDFNEKGPKLEISGIIYQRDGRTPARDVILYIYHTDQAGKYATRGNETGWGKRHGYIRGWVKTDANGYYRFFTLMPASYPNSRNPRHIHPTIKEPGKTEYYIDEFVFDDDPFLSTKEREKPNLRGGDGVLTPVLKDGMLHASRNIILGLNVPDYPVAARAKINSGLDIGANCPAFDPLHLSGADKGKHLCPMCKYGFGQGVMVWFNHNNLDQLKKFAISLEAAMNVRGEKKLRVFLVYMNPSYNQNNATGLLILQKKIIQWCEEQNLQKVAMLWVPSPVDEETCGVFKINPAAKNTVFVYKKRKVTAKWVDIDYDADALNKILQKIDQPA